MPAGPVLSHDPVADIVGYVIHIVLFILKKLVNIAVHAYHAAISILPGLVIGSACSVFMVLVVVAITFLTAIAIAFLAAVSIPFLAVVSILIAVIFVPVALLGICGCLLGNFGDKHRSYQRSSTYSHETAARLFHQPQPSPYSQNTYVRSPSQTYGQTPTTPAYNCSPHYSSHGHVSHPGESRQTTGGSHQTAPTSTYAWATYLVPAVNVEDLGAAEELRKRASIQHNKMVDARGLASSAHEKGYYAVERTHEQEAIAYKSARDQLNTRAAEIIFKHTNKVCI
jgi:hypothetical protein